MKLSSIRIANAVALSQGILGALCAVVSYVSPDLVISVAKSLPHALDLTPLVPVKPLTFEAGSFFIGLVSWMATTWLAGWLFGIFYNLLQAKEPARRTNAPRGADALN